MHFETLIETYHDEIYHYLWRLMQGSGCVQNADDLTQEVFIRAYGAYERLRPGSNVRAWLYKIATNCAYSGLNRQKRHRSRTTPLPESEHLVPADDSPTPAEIMEQVETAEELHAQIKRLPHKQQSALVMRYLQELSYWEIAEALECSEESARANVYQALKRLRDEYGGDNHDE